MLNKDIKFIIFDCYDTLLSIDSNQAYKHFFKNLQVDFNIDQKNLNYLYNLVKVEKNIDWQKSISSLTNYTFNQEAEKKLNSLLIDLEKNIQIDNQSIQPYSDINFLSLLKNHYKLFIFSNLAKGYEIKINEFLKPYFDKIYLSFEIGYQKPYPEAFDYVKKDIEKYVNSKIDYSNIALIDDKTINIESAKSLGMQAILIDRKLNHLTAINTIKQLLF